MARGAVFEGQMPLLHVGAHEGGVQEEGAHEGDRAVLPAPLLPGGTCF
jgi:hypothetical protein